MLKNCQLIGHYIWPTFVFASDDSRTFQIQIESETNAESTMNKFGLNEPHQNFQFIYKHNIFMYFFLFLSSCLQSMLRNCYRGYASADYTSVATVTVVATQFELNSFDAAWEWSFIGRYNWIFRYNTIFPAHHRCDVDTLCMKFTTAANQQRFSHLYFTLLNYCCLWTVYTKNKLAKERQCAMRQPHRNVEVSSFIWAVSQPVALKKVWLMSTNVFVLC